MKTRIFSLVLVLGLSTIIFAKNRESKTLTFQGIQRNYNIYFPKNYDSNKTYPLVLAFHGGGGNPEQFERTSGLDKMADNYGYILVYPAGTGVLKNKLLTWNPEMHIQTYSSKNNINDAGFVKKLVEILEQNYKINNKRIYIVGHSNGAMMVQCLASKYPDLFAAAVSVSGTIGGQTDENSYEKTINPPSSFIPFMEIHGMKDTNVNYYGGKTYGGFARQKDRIDISVARTIQFWTEANKCSSNPIITETAAYTKTDYNQCGNNSEVVLYSLKNGTHQFADIAGKLNLINVVGDFFNSHTLK